MNNDSKPQAGLVTRMQLFEQQASRYDRRRRWLIATVAIFIGLFCIVLIWQFGSQPSQNPSQAVQKASPIYLNTKAKYAIVVDANTGQILGQKDSNQLVGIASQSKMLTSYAVLTAIKAGQIKWTDKVLINHKTDWSAKNHATYSHLDIRAGDRVAVSELFAAMYTSSANDAALALADYVKPKKLSQQAALQKWAKELGLKGSKWYNAAGQVNRDAFDYQVHDAAPSAENEASVTQLAMLARKNILLDPEIRNYYQKLGLVYHPTPGVNKIEKTEYSRFEQEVLPKLHNNDNWQFEGLKTGSTPDSGGAFTGLLKDAQGHEIITVVSGSGRYTNQMQRYQDTVDVANQVARQFTPYDFIQGQTVKGSQTVANTHVKSGRTALIVAKTVTAWLPKASGHQSVGVYPPAKIKQGPVRAGSQVVVTQPALKADYLPNIPINERGIPMASQKGQAKANTWNIFWNWLLVH